MARKKKGDIVDGWQLRKHWHWPRAHNDVVQRILRKARSGTRVVFIPGNHDEFAREFIGYAFGDIEILDDEGRPVPRTRRTVALCRCGRSRLKPLCDGSHRLSRFRDPASPDQLDHVLTHATPYPDGSA